jgi:hypothetical protein
MTSASPVTESVPGLDTSIAHLRRVIPDAGCGMPAAALADPRTAAWVRAHGVSVTACADDELDMVQHNAIRPTQVVFRCGPNPDPTRRAVNLGVARFIVSTPAQIARLREFAQATKYLYLDDDSPLVLADRRLRVIGLHSDVDDSAGPVEWGSVAERLLCRTALLKTCGSPVKRIMLSGGTADAWLDDSSRYLTSMVCAVDDALRAGCQRWQVVRPAVTLSPSIAGSG